jgi:hypothetical protein
MDNTDMVNPRATSDARKRVPRFKSANPASIVMHLSVSTTDISTAC